MRTSLLSEGRSDARTKRLEGNSYWKCNWQTCPMPPHLHSLARKQNHTRHHYILYNFQVTHSCLASK